MFTTGAFYYILGNLSPMLRSKVLAIQLLLVAKYTTVLEFGIAKLLEPIVNDIRVLESVSYLISCSQNLVFSPDFLLISLYTYIVHIACKIRLVESLGLR